MGRPRTPPAVRAKQGGTSKRNAVSHRPNPTTPVLSKRIIRPTDIEPPKNLPPEGLELWHDLVQELAAVGAAQKKDVPALRLMCAHYGFAMQSLRVLAEQGSYAGGSMGQLVDHPAQRQFNTHSMAFLRYAGKFGGTLADALAIGLDAMNLEKGDGVNERLGANPRKAARTTTA